MYLSELFLKTLNGENTLKAAQKALEACNIELCRRMDGIVDELDCLRYFFNMDQNDEILSPSDRYQELIDFWDVYQEFDNFIPSEVKNRMWLLQMVFETDCSRITWEKEKRKAQLNPEQLQSFDVLCKEFEAIIGKKELVILKRGKTEFKVWEKFELQGFDGEGIIPERDFAENKLLKLFESEGIVVLIVGRIGLTPQRFYGYHISDRGCSALEQKEIGVLSPKLMEENLMAERRGKMRGNPRAYVERNAEKPE